MSLNNEKLQSARINAEMLFCAKREFVCLWDSHG